MLCQQPVSYTHLTNYDKEEFARIKKAAEYIKSNADILVEMCIRDRYERVQNS